LPRCRPPLLKEAAHSWRAASWVSGFGMPQSPGAFETLLAALENRPRRTFLRKKSAMMMAIARKPSRIAYSVVVWPSSRSRSSCTQTCSAITGRSRTSVVGRGSFPIVALGNLARAIACMDAFRAPNLCGTRHFSPSRWVAHEGDRQRTLRGASAAQGEEDHLVGTRTRRKAPRFTPPRPEPICPAQNV
jgi:hypothetical protein